MRPFVAITLALSALALASCGVSVSKTSESTAQEAVDKLTFARNGNTGECFAVVSSSKPGDLDSSMSITWVPCSPKVEAEIKK